MAFNYGYNANYGYNQLQPQYPITQEQRNIQNTMMREQREIEKQKREKIEEENKTALALNNAEKDIEATTNPILKFFKYTATQMTVIGNTIKNISTFIIVEGEKIEEYRIKAIPIIKNTEWIYTLITIFIGFLIYGFPIIITIITLVFLILYLIKFYKYNFCNSTSYNNIDNIYQSFFNRNFVYIMNMPELIFVYVIVLSIYLIIFIMTNYLSYFSKYIKWKDQNLRTNLYYSNIFMFITFTVVIIYIITNIQTFHNIVVLLNDIDNNIYNNINIEYIDSICNFEKLNGPFAAQRELIPTQTDKLCDAILISGGDDNIFRKYIEKIVDEIKIKNVGINIKNINEDGIKSFKNANGIPYNELIFKSFITHSLLQYVNSHNYTDDIVNRFFSKNNLNNTNWLSNRISVMQLVSDNNREILPFRLTDNFFTIDDINNAPFMHDIYQRYYSLVQLINDNSIKLYTKFNYFWSPSIICIILLPIYIIIFIFYVYNITQKAKIITEQGYNPYNQGQGMIGYQDNNYLYNSRPSYYGGENKVKNIRKTNTKHKIIKKK